MRVLYSVSMNHKIPFNSTLYFELFTVGNVSLDFSVNIEIGKFDCHKFRSKILCKVSYLNKIMSYLILYEQRAYPEHFDSNVYVFNFKQLVGCVYGNGVE